MRTIDRGMRDINRSAAQFGRSLSDAFTQGVNGSRGLDDVLKSLYLRLSDIALRLAFKPLENALTAGFSGLFAGTGGAGPVQAFASGGIIGTPTYFPLRSGGAGLAGEAGPEAIMPLRRGPDGRLGVAATGSAAASITVNIATPDADSFRRSELYVTGQIARAVARGQRGM
ncbi:MAG TPA: phage tail tape measure protein [Pseudorhodoplanes sp.]|nr:phage tail tape measure protein [Pseudorhodoplanes sp.]HWV55565.1 phage tail tape measure protein [Pseudorhodoplanes sp.]